MSAYEVNVYMYRYCIIYSMDRKNIKYLEMLRHKKRLLQALIDAGGECGSLIHCDDCPLAMITQRSDGSWVSCAAAVAEANGIKDKETIWNLGDNEWVKVAVKLLCDLEVEEMLLSDKTREEDPK